MLNNIIEIEAFLSHTGSKIAEIIAFSQKLTERAIEAQREIEELYLLLGDIAEKNNPRPPAGEA